MGAASPLVIPMRAVFLAIVFSLSAGQALAQVKMRCLSDTEVQVEQLVRHGVFLREAGRRCDEVIPGTNKLWTDFDQRWGTRLKQQTDKRAKMFTRQFKDDALKVRTYFDGRLVTYHRNYPLSLSYCTDVKEMLDELAKRGWGGFTAQAKVVQSEVLLDYKACQ
jgi:hypothetical protein